MERCVEIIGKLEEILAGMGDAHVPYLREMPLEGGGVEDRRALVFPADRSWGWYVGVSRSIIIVVKRRGRIHTNSSFLLAHNPHEWCNEQTRDEAPNETWKRQMEAVGFFLLKFFANGVVVLPSSRMIAVQIPLPDGVE
jgi:hypothetical protein